MNWRKERYELAEAFASFEEGDLWVIGRSDDCGIYFCAIPFGEVTTLREIKGQTYSSEGGTPFSEGRVRIGEVASNMNGGEVTCIGVSSEQDFVAIEFTVTVVLDQSGRERKLTGGVRCRVVSQLPYEDEIFQEYL